MPAAGPKIPTSTCVPELSSSVAVPKMLQAASVTCALLVLRLQISLPRPPSRRFRPRDPARMALACNPLLSSGSDSDVGGDATDSPRCASTGGEIRQAAGGTSLGRDTRKPSPRPAKMCSSQVLRESTPKASSPKAACPKASHSAGKPSREHMFVIMPAGRWSRGGGFC